MRAVFPGAPGFCAQSITLFKGGPKHQLKAQGLALVGGSLSNFPTALCVCECSKALVCDELLNPSSPLQSAMRDSLRETLNYCFPNNPQSIWNGLRLHSQKMNLEEPHDS